MGVILYLSDKCPVCNALREDRSLQSVKKVEIEDEVDKLVDIIAVPALTPDDGATFYYGDKAIKEYINYHLLDDKIPF